MNHTLTLHEELAAYSNNYVTIISCYHPLLDLTLIYIIWVISHWIYPYIITLLHYHYHYYYIIIDLRSTLITLIHSTECAKPYIQGYRSRMRTLGRFKRSGRCCVVTSLFRWRAASGYKIKLSGFLYPSRTLEVSIILVTKCTSVFLF